jgi:hypothetical protein
MLKLRRLLPSRTAVRASFFAFTVSSSLHASDAAATARQQVADLRPLLLAALEHGEAHGVLVGEAARWAAQVFNTTAPIEIDVTTVTTLRQPGCKRLAITTTQDGVWDFNRTERAPAAERKSFTWMVNYCRDGRLVHEEAP